MLCPATNQPPEFWACETASEAAIRPGLACRHDEVIRFSRGCGIREIGIRARTLGGSQERAGAALGPRPQGHVVSPLHLKPVRSP